MAKSRKADPANLILFRNDEVFIVMNKYPYNAGHLLIVPKRHVGLLERLSPDQSLALMQASQQAVAVMKKVLKPGAFNLGMNLGRPAGAGIPGHLHMHIVPRWIGDSNFMPVIGKTRVHSLSLNLLYEALAKGFASV